MVTLMFDRQGLDMMAVGQLSSGNVTRGKDGDQNKREQSRSALVVCEVGSRDF